MKTIRPSLLQRNGVGGKPPVIDVSIRSFIHLVYAHIAIVITCICLRENYATLARVRDSGYRCDRKSQSLPESLAANLNTNVTRTGEIPLPV